MAALQDIQLKRIDGGGDTLAAHKGKVLLIVNVASKCGLTPQYAGLEKLFEDKRAAGLDVLGFPANNFLGQEPGSDSEIADFCATTYAVQFPMYSKISVAGADQHPLYAALIAANPTPLAKARSANGSRARILAAPRLAFCGTSRNSSSAVTARWLRASRRTWPPTIRGLFR